jgi:hypothetical protein
MRPIRESSISRAAHDTAEQVSHWMAKMMFSLASLLAGLLAAFYLVSLEHQGVQQTYIDVIGTTVMIWGAGNITCYCIYFLLNLSRATARQRNEARSIAESKLQMSGIVIASGTKQARFRFPLSASQECSSYDGGEGIIVIAADVAISNLTQSLAELDFSMRVPIPVALNPSSEFTYLACKSFPPVGIDPKYWDPVMEWLSKIGRPVFLAPPIRVEPSRTVKGCIVFVVDPTEVDFYQNYFGFDISDAFKRWPTGLMVSDRLSRNAAFAHLGGRIMLP